MRNYFKKKNMFLLLILLLISVLVNKGIFGVISILISTGIISLSLLGVYCTSVAFYNVFISFKGFGKAKRDYDLIEDKAKFLILIASHNEEKVIASTIENLREIDYDKNLYKIMVVNDNSTDRTEEECIRVGAEYINTNGGLFEREAVGKPGGLQYALRYLGFEKLKDEYDLVLVLDADNHVSPNILKELNSQWFAKNKPTAIQSFLDSKNFDKILSFGYANAYVVSNRFFQLAKYRLGLPCALGGTGFAVTTEYLINSGGFNYKSLTEDLEMEIDIVNNGGEVLWNHFGRIYDEKPDDIKISIKQRTRWMQGHWFVAFNNFMPLVTKFFKERKLKYLDQLIYLFGGAKVVQLTIIILSGIVSIIGKIINSEIIGLSNFYMFVLNSMFNVSIVYLTLLIYQMVIIPYYAYKHDTRIEFNFFKMLISSFYYAITFMYCQLAGLFKWKHQHTWVKTEHKVKKIKES